MVKFICLVIDGAGKAVNDPFHVDVPEGALISDITRAVPGHQEDSRAVIWQLTPPIGISSISDKLCTFHFDFSILYERSRKATVLSDRVRSYADFFPLEQRENFVHFLIRFDADEEKIAKRRRLNEPLNTSPCPSLLSLHVFWKALWDAPEESIPFISLQDVVRDGTLGDIAVPKKCWTLCVDDTRTRTVLSLPLPTVILRDDYMVAIKHLIRDIGWDYSHLPESFDIESPSPFANPLWGYRHQQKSPKLLGFVLTGHPGIGKSVWLFIVLVLRLHAKLPTIYQCSSQEIYFFSGEGIKEILSFRDFNDLKAENTMVWGLVDSNRDVPSVNMAYTKTKIFTIQTPSPRADKLEWIKKITRRMFILKPWTLSELIVGRQFQTLAPSEKEVALFLEQYGQSARLAYQCDSMELYEQDLQMALQSLTLDHVETALQAASSFNFDEGISQMILTINSHQNRHAVVIEIASNHVYQCLVKVLETRVQDAAQRLYLIFNRNLFTKDACGKLLEPAIHTLVDLDGVWSLFQMKPSPTAGHKYKHWLSEKVTQVYLHVHEANFSIQESSVKVAASNHAKHYVFHAETAVLRSGYYRPWATNQATFDGFFYCEPDKHALVFQATVSPKHDMKEAGIEQLKSLGVKTISYIVVTPKDTSMNLSFPLEVQGLTLNRPYQMELSELPKEA